LHLSPPPHPNPNPPHQIQEYQQYVNWPLNSLKLDDVYALYQARETRDACDLGYTLQVDGTGAVTGVTVTSVAAPAGVTSCAAPLLTAAGQSSVAVPAGGSASVSPSGLTWAAPLP